jgi:hypothetical protein
MYNTPIKPALTQVRTWRDRDAAVLRLSAVKIKVIRVIISFELLQLLG